MTNERAMIRFTALCNLIDKLHEDCMAGIASNHVLMSKFMHLRHLSAAFAKDLKEWGMDLLLGKVVLTPGLEATWHNIHMTLLLIGALIDDAANRLKFDLDALVRDTTVPKKDIPEELWN